MQEHPGVVHVWGGEGELCVWIGRLGRGRVEGQEVTVGRGLLGPGRPQEATGCGFCSKRDGWRAGWCLMGGVKRTCLGSAKSLSLVYEQRLRRGREPVKGTVVIIPEQKLHFGRL